MRAEEHSEHGSGFALEITERLSSNALLGFSRFISSTNTQPDPIAGAIFLVRMSMRDGELRVEENQVGYSDRITTEGAARPIAVDGVYTYSVKGETLAIHYDQTTFDVDPVTLSRAKTGEKSPTQVSHPSALPRTFGENSVARKLAAAGYQCWPKQKLSDERFRKFTCAAKSGRTSTAGNPASKGPLRCNISAARYMV